MYRHFLKRCIDLLLSFLGLVILSPLFLVLILAIKIDSKGPVLFKQKRVGKNCTYFNILKFRTMSINTPHDIPTHLLENPEQYITNMGKFLRTTSLDELPQFLNILAGQMAVIGPRPALWNQTDLIEAREQQGVNAVRPGLTGWAQINGRDELTIPVKVQVDAEYIQRMSFLFDMRCFFGTIVKVLSHKGVVEGGTGELKKKAVK